MHFTKVIQEKQISFYDISSYNLSLIYDAEIYPGAMDTVLSEPSFDVQIIQLKLSFSKSVRRAPVYLTPIFCTNLDLFIVL